MPKHALSIRIDIGPHRIGPGKIALLKAVREHGSVTAAAKALGMSYRRAWSLSEALNAMGAAPLIRKASGGAARGGAQLTPDGERVLALCERLVASAGAAADRELQDLVALLGEPD